MEKITPELINLSNLLIISLCNTNYNKGKQYYNLSLTSNYDSIINLIPLISSFFELPISAINHGYIIHSVNASLLFFPSKKYNGHIFMDTQSVQNSTGNNIPATHNILIKSFHDTQNHENPENPENQNSILLYKLYRINKTIFNPSMNNNNTNTDDNNCEEVVIYQWDITDYMIIQVFIYKNITAHIRVCILLDETNNIPKNKLDKINNTINKLNSLSNYLVKNIKEN